MVVEYMTALETVYPAREGRIQFITDDEISSCVNSAPAFTNSFIIMYSLCITKSLLLK